MKKKLVQGILFVGITLLLPLLLTRLFTRYSSGTNLPNIDDIRIYPSLVSNTSIDLETYVTGVVLASIPTTYESETLKAQAVIARTYALKNISIYDQQSNTTAIIDSLTSRSKGYTITELGLPYLDSSSYLESMGTKNYETYLSKVKQAVLETKGEVITYKKNLITPLYFSTSAGKTRDSGELWAIPIPYLVSVDSNQDVESANYMKISILTANSVVQALQTAYQNKTLGAADYDYQVYETLPIDSSNFFDSVTIVKRDSVGYVLTVSLGGVLVSGDSFASALSLNSSYFYIDNYEDSVRFICNGSGHGIGFSQYGANVLAKTKEYTYTDLLKYYYTGVKIQKANSLY